VVALTYLDASAIVKLVVEEAGRRLLCAAEADGISTHAPR